MECEVNMASNTNFFLSSFPGLGLNPTTSFSLPPNATFSDLCGHINNLLPDDLNTRLLLSTSSGRAIFPTHESAISLRDNGSNIVSLRLKVPLCGGKGGFGSQLRAAGGRMSSRKKRNAGEQNGSNRNLDGRRLRTITEAKNLAEYLALKPEMDAKQREERKKRWQTVIDAAERKEDELKRGAKGKGLSEEWIDDRDDIAERAREAVRKAMAGGDWRDNLAGHELLGGSSSSAEGEASGSGDGDSKSPSEEHSEMEDGTDDEIEAAGSSKTAAAPQRRFAGFDDEDEEYMSDSEPEVEEPEGKGKGKA